MVIKGIISQKYLYELRQIFLSSNNKLVSKKIRNNTIGIQKGANTHFHLS